MSTASIAPWWALPVDAAGEAGHHVHAGLHEAVPEHARRMPTGRGGVACADDGDTTPVEQAPIATREQHRRRERVVPQQRRMVGVAERGDLQPELQASFPHRLGRTHVRLCAPDVTHVRLREHVRRADRRGGGGAAPVAIANAWSAE